MLDVLETFPGITRHVHLGTVHLSIAELANVIGLISNANIAAIHVEIFMIFPTLLWPASQHQARVRSEDLNIRWPAVTRRMLFRR